MIDLYDDYADNALDVAGPVKALGDKLLFDGQAPVMSFRISYEMMHDNAANFLGNLIATGYRRFTVAEEFNTKAYTIMCEKAYRIP
jgi:hypothetical protein